MASSCRVQYICSIIANYEALEMTLDEAITATQDTETKARIQGVAAQMRTFGFFFGSMLGELVLTPTDSFSKTIQHTSMSAAEGQQVTAMKVATLNSVCSDERFEQFWEVVTKKADKLGVNELQLPRCRKLPRRFDDGLSGGVFMASPKAHFQAVLL